MTVGAVTETVSVEANPVQVDTVSGTLSQVVEQGTVNAMPLNGRNAASLTTLVGGVVVAPSASTDQGITKTFPVAVTITANGTRVGETDYMLDGGNNIDEWTNVNAPFPFPDALQEFSVQTSNYSAEYGQNAGGVVNIITKSGSSSYHGDLFEFVRNRVFNAANYFSYPNGVKTVDPQKRNQLGGTFGGPVKIPHVFHSDKSFFFVGWQTTVFHTNATSATGIVLPTTDQLNGIFANEKNCIQNPFRGTNVYPCVQNGTTYTTTVDTADYNQAALALLKYVPSGGTSGHYSFIKPTQQHYNEFVGKFDQGIGNNDRLTARYYYDSFHNMGINDTKNLLTYSDQADIRYHNALIAETHTFGTHIVNNFLVNYQHENSTRGPLPGGISVADLGVNIWQPATKQINQIQVAGGYFTIGDNPQGQFLRNNYTLRDDLHDLVGNHSLSFGLTGEVSKFDMNNLYQQPGTFSFNSNNTNDAIASFLLGYVGTFNQSSGQFANLRGKFFGFYVQDSWHLNRRLTVNYGLRFEPFVPEYDAQKRMGGFSPQAYALGLHSTLYPNGPIGLLFEGDPGYSSNINNSYSHFMPRVGFAWNVLSSGKLSVRGGAGTFYDTRLGAAYFNLFFGNSPFITNVSLSNTQGQKISFTDPYGSYGITNPFPAQQPPPATTAFPVQNWLINDPFKPGFRDPMFYQWNLGVEYQATKSLVTRAAYAGSHGSHLATSLEMNPTWNSGSNAGQRIYSPAYASEKLQITTHTGANSHYDSLQLSAEQRASRSLTLLANYTWSKSLDNVPANSTSTGGGPDYVMPIYVANYTRLDRGRSDFDHRNVTSISYVYSFPQLARASLLVREVANGWQTSGIFQFRSGDPLTIFSGANNNSGTGQTYDRAVMSGAPYGGNACGTSVHCKSYLNPLSFTNNPAGTYGTFVKGSLTGPQYADWDVALVKAFPIRESVNVEFRAEYFNVLNHTNFSDPGMTVNSTLGQITGSSDPRIGQLSLKLTF